MIGGYNWLLVGLDGEASSSEERHWTEVAVLRDYGSEQLYLTKEPAAQLSTVVGARQYTVRAPDRDSRFFIFVRSRMNLFSSETETSYFAMGYVCAHGKHTMEIDARGNVTSRFEPTLG